MIASGKMVAKSESEQKRIVHRQAVAAHSRRVFPCNLHHAEAHAGAARLHSPDMPRNTSLLPTDWLYATCDTQHI